MSYAVGVYARELFANAFKGVARDPSSPFYVFLFVNDHTPTPTSLTDDFVNASFTGGDPILVTLGDFTGPDADGDDRVMHVVPSPLVWNCTGSPETVYGWYLYDIDNDHWLMGEKYDTPHVLEVGSRHTLYIDVAVTQAA